MFIMRDISVRTTSWSDAEQSFDESIGCRGAGRENGNIYWLPSVAVTVVMVVTDRLCFHLRMFVRFNYCFDLGPGDRILSLKHSCSAR
jgi:hypothetical protein